MKKFGFRHLMYGWLAVVALVLTSCDSENGTPINDKTLPEAIAKDSTNAARTTLSNAFTQGQCLTSTVEQ